jgi:TRAP-type C4-dicarboxylate transport system permease small subunit
MIAGFLAAIFILTLILVFLRYALNQSITGANEIATILFIYITGIGSAISIGKDEHISINIFTDIIPEKFHKSFKILQVLLIFFLHFILLIFCLKWIYTAGGYLMPATGLPRIVAIASIPLTCLLSILYCFSILNNIVKEDTLIDTSNNGPNEPSNN